MKSIRELYRTGHGPSSSHTMGPRIAADRFLKRTSHASRFKCFLYGSLAATGKGHLTDFAIDEAFKKYPLEIIWKPDLFLPFHPNALKFEAYNSEGQLIDSQISYSIGGGAVVDEGEEYENSASYPLTKLDDIIQWCVQKDRQLWQYVEENEDPEINDFLSSVWSTMHNSIRNGLQKEGELPGGLHLPRKALSFKIRQGNISGPDKKRSRLFSYALAVSEENAGGGIIVTAPTCGACGVVPAIINYFREVHKSTPRQIQQALATAGLIGNLVKENASISGAEVGCQGEVGTACAMASAAATQLMGGSVSQIEYAAEMGLEHHLGLTCDPVLGLVQIPCIERNALAAERALAHQTYAMMSDGRHRISFDEVVETMYQTGKDLSHHYKETSQGGLARHKGLPKSS